MHGEREWPRRAMLLAGGLSRRMGQPKALLPWRGTSLIHYGVEQLKGAGVPTIVVVIGPIASSGDVPGDRHVPGIEDMLADVEGIEIVRNPWPETGRSGSIRLAAEALPDGEGGIVVQSVDQPCPAAVLDALYRVIESSDAMIAVPEMDGRRGHPTCVSSRLLSELRAVDEASFGLRAVVQRHLGKRVAVPVYEPCVLLNMNEPSAYESAFARLGEG